MLTNLYLVARSVIIQEPLCLIWVAGLLMAWIQRYENAKLSFIVALSMLLFLISAVGGVYFTSWVPLLFYNQISLLPAWAVSMLTFNMPMRLIVDTIAWSLLLFGTFNWRRTQWQ